MAIYSLYIMREGAFGDRDLKGKLNWSSLSFFK